MERLHLQVKKSLSEVLLAYEQLEATPGDTELLRPLYQLVVNKPSGAAYLAMSKARVGERSWGQKAHVLPHPSGWPRAPSDAACCFNPLISCTLVLQPSKSGQQVVSCHRQHRFPLQLSW